MSEGTLLRGLDGSNPLAFLAALGTLRTLTLALPGEKVKMNWEQSDGAWRPRVFCSLDGDALVERLAASLVKDRQSHPTRFIDYKSSNQEVVDFFRSVRAGADINPGLDAWIASLTNDIHPDATSPLQLTRSDYFVGNLDQVMANTTNDHLRKSLLLRWTYDDALSGQSLHLEPTEDRRHAYQWNQPSGDPNRNKSGNMLGANRLAIEALPLFTGLPSSNPARLLMTGWTGVRSDDATWTWPIWSQPIGLTIVPSVLAMAELQQVDLPAAELIARGIRAAYRTRRILVEKTPNLTPAVALLSVPAPSLSVPAATAASG
jgi:CRISPR-associated endonuclease/helicase Cas3